MVFLIASGVDRLAAFTRDIFAHATTCSKSQDKPDDASQAANAAQAMMRLNLDMTSSQTDIPGIANLERLASPVSSGLIPDIRQRSPLDPPLQHS